MAINISQQLFLGVAYIHSRGYLHRDIKPDNLLILDNSSNIHIKISDFGLAIKRKKIHHYNNNHSVTYLPSEHGYAGTPLYMSPEVLHGMYDVSISLCPN